METKFDMSIWFDGYNNVVSRGENSTDYDNPYMPDLEHERLAYLAYKTGAVAGELLLKKSESGLSPLEIDHLREDVCFLEEENEKRRCSLLDLEEENEALRQECAKLRDSLEEVKALAKE